MWDAQPIDRFPRVPVWDSLQLRHHTEVTRPPFGAGVVSDDHTAILRVEVIDVVVVSVPGIGDEAPSVPLGRAPWPCATLPYPRGLYLAEFPLDRQIPVGILFSLWVLVHFRWPCQGSPKGCVVTTAIGVGCLRSVENLPFILERTAVIWFYYIAAHTYDVREFVNMKPIECSW